MSGTAPCGTGWDLEIDFHDNKVLSERFYRLSMQYRTDPHLPKTNLARRLTRRGGPAEPNEAPELLAQASSSVPPTFPLVASSVESLRALPTLSRG